MIALGHGVPSKPHITNNNMLAIVGKMCSFQSLCCIRLILLPSVSREEVVLARTNTYYDERHVGAAVLAMLCIYARVFGRVICSTTEIDHSKHGSFKPHGWPDGDHPTASTKDPTINLEKAVCLTGSDQPEIYFASSEAVASWLLYQSSKHGSFAL